MDPLLYSTTALIGIITPLAVQGNFLRSLFFGATPIEFDEPEVLFDRVFDDKRIAPWVSPYSKGTPGQDRVKAVRVKDAAGAWVPIDPAATYTVVSNNFLRGGGDGYKVFTEKGRNAYDYGPNMEDAVVAYLQAGVAAYAPYVDGRIREVE